MRKLLNRPALLGSESKFAGSALSRKPLVRRNWNPTPKRLKLLQRNWNLTPIQLLLVLAIRPQKGYLCFISASVKCRNASLRTPQNQRVNVVRAFVGVDHFQVHQVPGHAIFIADAVAAHHVARQAGNVE